MPGANPHPARPIDDVFIGTSGWQYRHWRGPFYPPEVPQKGWLSFYADRFSVVEVNATFYRLPTEATVDRWRSSTPESFRFAVKASRYITHIKRLASAAAEIAQFYDRMSALREKRGPVLFQTPPTLPLDLASLRSTLDAIPDTGTAAFEFRHPSWQSDAVTDLLNDHGSTWVVADRAGSAQEIPQVGGWSYIRFHQGPHEDTSYGGALDAWPARLERAAAPRYVFFNNDAQAAAIRDAAYLRAAVGAVAAAV